MSITLTKYQEDFKKKLVPDMVAIFDQIVAEANKAKTVQEFMSQIPEDFHGEMKTAKTIGEALEVVLKLSNWGTAKYEPPVAKLTPKAKPGLAIGKPVIGKPVIGKPGIQKPAVAKPVVAKPVVAAEGKRRGNPEALAKARAAKGAKTPEQVDQDRNTIIAAATELCTENKEPVPVKDLVRALVASLAGNGSDGKDLSENFIYSTITEEARKDDCPIMAAQVEGRNRFYQVRQ